MRHINDWKRERILERLRLETESREFNQQYEILKSREPVLARFGSPEALIGTLRAPRGASYNEKDAVLYALIRTVQTRSELRGCGQVLLVLAMWPALEHSFFKLLPLATRLPDLFAEIHWRFLEEVASHDLTKRSKIAINLQLDTEKRVKRSVSDEDRYRDFSQAYSLISADFDQVFDEPGRNRTARVNEWIESIPARELRRSLRAAWASEPPDNAALEPLVQAAQDWKASGYLAPEECSLITDHAVRGIPLADIARELGISSGAARVRYHRLKLKLQRGG